MISTPGKFNASHARDGQLVDLACLLRRRSLAGREETRALVREVAGRIRLTLGQVEIFDDEGPRPTKFLRRISAPGHPRACRFVHISSPGYSTSFVSCTCRRRATPRLLFRAHIGVSDMSNCLFCGPVVTEAREPLGSAVISSRRPLKSRVLRSSRRFAVL